MATRLEFASDHKPTLQAALHLPEEPALSYNSWKEMAALSPLVPSHQQYHSLPVPDIYEQTSTASNQSAMINEVAGSTFLSLGGSMIGNGFNVRDLTEREGSSSLARGFFLSTGIESAELAASTMLAKNHDFFQSSLPQTRWKAH